LEVHNSGGECDGKRGDDKASERHEQRHDARVLPKEHCADN
jgi:hypothetical protein